MRGKIRLLGTVLAVTGVLAIAWALVVWQWQDPFTALYTVWKQHQLTAQYAKRASAFRATAPSRSSLTAERRDVAAEAQGYRLETHRGQPIGRIVVPRMGVNMILVDGTDHGSLTKGPGRDLATYMPGENRLVYIAGTGRHTSRRSRTSTSCAKATRSRSRFRTGLSSIASPDSGSCRRTISRFCAHPITSCSSSRPATRGSSPPTGTWSTQSSFA